MTILDYLWGIALVAGAPVAAMGLWLFYLNRRRKDQGWGRSGESGVAGHGVDRVGGENLAHDQSDQALGR